jgi:hypothetical protein
MDGLHNLWGRLGPRCNDMAAVPAMPPGNNRVGEAWQAGALLSRDPDVAAGSDSLQRLASHDRFMCAWHAQIGKHDWPARHRNDPGD